MGPSRVLWPQTYRLPDTQQKPAGWKALGNAGWRWEVLPRPRIISSLTALTAKPANCEAQMLAMGCGCMETPGLSTDSYLQGWSGGNLWGEGSSDHSTAHWG